MSNTSVLNNKPLTSKLHESRKYTRRYRWDRMLFSPKLFPIRSHGLHGTCLRPGTSSSQRGIFHQRPPEPRGPQKSLDLGVRHLWNPASLPSRTWSSAWQAFGVRFTCETWLLAHQSSEAHPVEAGAWPLPSTQKRQHVLYIYIYIYRCVVICIYILAYLEFRVPVFAILASWNGTRIVVGKPHSFHVLSRASAAAAAEPTRLHPKGLVPCLQSFCVWLSSPMSSGRWKALK